MAQSRSVRSKKAHRSIDWKHPLVLLAATSIFGAAGWGAKEWYSSLDRSDLRADLEHPRQAVKVSRPLPDVLGAPVFCDTVAVSLVLAHSVSGARPVTVNGIELVQEPVAPDQRQKVPSTCAVDPFGDRPYGIGERNVFSVSLNQNGATARYIAGTKHSEAWIVPTSNLLSGAGHSTVISLKRDEEPVTFEIFITSRLDAASRIYFRINYDSVGERSLVTSPVQLVAAER